MAEKLKRLTSSQLKEAKDCFKRMGIDRNKSSSLLSDSKQWDTYQWLLSEGKIKPVAPVKPVLVEPASPSPSAVQSAFKLGQESVKKPGRGPGRKPKRVRYSILLDSDLLDTYNRLSSEQERPASELMRLALRRAIQQPLEA
jgi:hypothetical protein